MARIVGNRIVPDEIIEQDTWRTNMNPQNQWGNYGINTLGNAPFRGLEQFPQAHAGVAGPEYLEEDVLNMNQNLDDLGIYTHQKGEPFLEENRGNILKNLINPEVNWRGYQRGPNDFNINNLGIMGILKAIGGERSPEKQAFYDEVMQGRSLEPWQTGTYKGNQYGLYNSPSGLKVSSDVLGWGEGYEKNFDSAFGSKSIEEMEQKKLDWALNRISKGKAISQRLRDVLTARGLIGGNIGDQRPGRITETVTDVVRPGDGAATTGGQTSRPDMTIRDFNPREAQRAAPGGYSGRGGSGSGPQGGAGYGPWRAEGGRIGYNRGRVVNPGGYAGEIEFDENIEGPGYDENILEIMKGQGVPFGEQVQGEQDILSMLVVKYIEAGFPADQAQEMAMQELQQMVAQSGQGEGIASLV